MVLFCNMTCSVSLPLELIPKEQVTQEPNLFPHPGWPPARLGRGVILTWVSRVPPGLHGHHPGTFPACQSLWGEAPSSRSGPKNVRLRKCPSL